MGLGSLRSSPSRMDTGIRFELEALNEIREGIRLLAKQLQEEIPPKDFMDQVNTLRNRVDETYHSALNSNNAHALLRATEDLNTLEVLHKVQVREKKKRKI